MDPELVDRIYECSLVPEHWPGVLDELGRIAETPGGSLFITKADVHYWTASPGIRDRAGRLVNEGWFWRGKIAARGFGARHAGFLTDLDVLAPEELDQEPIYRDFWRPQGAGWIVATIIPLSTGENVVFVLTRWTERGPVERTVVQRLDDLRPHLARSAFLSARLQLERARMASETLAALGLPALVLNEQGKVLAANSLVEPLTYVQWRAFDRISLKDKAADQFLRDAISAIGVAGGSVRSFPVRDRGAEAMMVAHVVLIRLSARDIFVRCAAARHFCPLRRRARFDPRYPPASAARRAGAVAVRSDAFRGARRPQSRRRRNGRGHRLCPRCLAKHDPRARCPRRFGKNRLQPANRCGRASDRHIPGAANDSAPTGSNSQKIVKILARLIKC
jgi:hypothetical protein